MRSGDRAHWNCSRISVGWPPSICQDGKFELAVYRLPSSSISTSRVKVVRRGSGSVRQRSDLMSKPYSASDWLPLTQTMPRFLSTFSAYGVSLPLRLYRQIEQRKLAAIRFIARDLRFAEGDDPQVAVGVRAQPARPQERRRNHRHLAAGRLDLADFAAVQAREPDRAVGRDVDAVHQRHAGRFPIDRQPVGQRQAPVHQLEQETDSLRDQPFLQAARRQIVQREFSVLAVELRHLVGQRQREPDPILGIDADRVRIEAGADLVQREGLGLRIELDQPPLRRRRDEDMAVARRLRQRVGVGGAVVARKILQPAGNQAARLVALPCAESCRP